MTGRNWHGAYLAVLTVLFALEAWLSGSQQQVIAATFPAWSRHLWYGGLITGALLVLAGIVLHTVTGLLIERAALFVLAALCGAYGLAFLAASTRAGADPGHLVYAVVLVLAFAGVNLLRARQIRREIDQTRSELRRLGDAREALS